MKKLLRFALAFLAMSATPTWAGSLLLDRGLPNANLNLAAGASRSNAAWLPGGSYMLGDDFTLVAGQDYFVETIRLWSTTSPSATVWIGAANGTFANYTPSWSFAYYADSSTYQRVSSPNEYVAMYQLDISLNAVLHGGTTYQFYLDDSGQQIAALHSSNAALSGTPQDGANNLMLRAYLMNGAVTNVSTWSGSASWDKATDANVQVYGTPVPEPASLFLLGTGLIGAVRAARRKRE